MTRAIKTNPTTTTTTLLFIYLFILFFTFFISSINDTLVSKWYEYYIVWYVYGQKVIQQVKYKLSNIFGQVHVEFRCFIIM